MNPNGHLDPLEAFDITQQRAMLRGAQQVDGMAAAMQKVAAALQFAGQILHRMSGQVDRIGKDTALALSTATAMQHHLKDITDREQVLRAEVDELKKPKRLRKKRKARAKAKK